MKTHPSILLVPSSWWQHCTTTLIPDQKFPMASKIHVLDKTIQGPAPFLSFPFNLQGPTPCHIYLIQMMRRVTAVSTNTSLLLDYLVLTRKSCLFAYCHTNCPAPRQFFCQGSSSSSWETSSLWGYSQLLCCSCLHVSSRQSGPTWHPKYASPNPSLYMWYTSTQLTPAGLEIYGRQ